MEEIDIEGELELIPQPSSLALLALNQSKYTL